MEMTGPAISVVDVGADMNSSAGPRRVTPNLAAASNIPGIAWTRDGRELVYGTAKGGWWASRCLWRVPADGSQAPTRLDLAGQGAGDPAISPSGDRLTFTRDVTSWGVFRFVRGGSPVPVLRSSFEDVNAIFSADGTRLAFVSSRSGDSTNIWTSNADGTDARQLTHGQWQLSPSWSADDRQIAFMDLTPEGRWHIWVVDADGSAPHQVTHGDSEFNPSWSPDGQWVYFSANDAGADRTDNHPQVGHYKVWRVRSGGGTPEPLALVRPEFSGGVAAVPTADGRSLVYRSPQEGGPLMIMPLGGEPARPLVACADALVSVAGGIYYVPCGSGVSPEVRWLNPATGETRSVAVLEDGQPSGFNGTLAVSPDERTILFGRYDPGTSGLWTIENFR
jgi:Tol biopolymer transport system component